MKKENFIELNYPKKDCKNIKLLKDKKTLF